MVVLAAILLLGAGIRAAFLSELRHDPGLAHPAVDAAFNLHWARGLATGDWSLPADAAGRDPRIRETAFQRPPGYPYVLAGLYRATGGHPLGIRAIQLAAGLVAAFLAWRLGRRLAGPAVGLTWAGFMTVHWGFLYYAGGLNGMWLIVPLSLAVVEACHRTAVTARPAAAAVLGCTMGLIALVRSNALLAAALLGVWMLVVLTRRHGIRRAAISLGVAAAVGALTLTPAMVRNFVVSGHLVPISANGGLTLFHGNHPAATGFSTAAASGDLLFASPWHAADLMARLSEERGEPVDYVEASRAMGRRAKEWIASEPARAAGLVGTRALLFWGPDEIAHSTPVAADRAWSPLLRRLPFDFSQALAGGLWGLATLLWPAARRELREGALVAVSAGVVLVLGWFTSFLPFFVTSLYRLPVVTALLFGAALGCVTLVRFLARRNWRPALGSAFLFAGFWAAASLTWVPVDAGRTERHIMRGSQWRTAGDLERAYSAFQAALDATPESGAAANGLGTVLMDQGRADEALPLFRRAVRADPRNPLWQSNLGLALATLGRWSEALSPLDQAARLAPNLAATQALLGMANEVTGNHAAAAAAYRAALNADSDHFQAANNLAWLLATSPEASLRDGAEAVDLAEGCVAIRRSPSTLDTLAAALARAGRFEEAVAVQEEALRLNRASQEVPQADLEGRLASYVSGKAYQQPLVTARTTPDEPPRTAE